MSYIGYGLTCLLLLLFIRGSIEKLHPIIQVIVFMLFVVQIYQQLIKPLFMQLATSFSSVPYSPLLLYSAFLLLLNQLVQTMLEEREEQSIGQAISLAIRASIIGMWIVQLRPIVLQMTTLLQKFS